MERCGKKHMHYPSMFLIGADFWDKILPNDISFNNFTEIYASALAELDLNKHINEMIHNCINNL